MGVHAAPVRHRFNRHPARTRWSLFAAAAALAAAGVLGSGAPASQATTPIAFGFYAPPGTARTDALQQIGGHAAILNSFFGWTDSFPQDFVTQAVSVGAVPMITWTPKTVSLTKIASGSEDTYIKSWASAARAAGTTVYIRFAHEMNGRWEPWGYGVNGNTAAEYVAAWRHVVDIFRAENALNVKWIWCIATSGDQDPTVIQSLFPGDNYVDWVAMDGYNRNRNGNWRSFSTIFSTDYQLLTTMSTRPVMIAETASVEDSSDPTRKAAWIQDAFLNAIPNYFPRIQAALYFDSSDTACPSLPWSSSSAALTAVQSVLSSSAYTP